MNTTTGARPLMRLILNEVAYSLAHVAWALWLVFLWISIFFTSALGIYLGVSAAEWIAGSLATLL